MKKIPRKYAGWTFAAAVVLAATGQTWLVGIALLCSAMLAWHAED